MSSHAIWLDEHPQIGALHWADGDTSAGGLGQPVAGLKCNVTSQAYHVHSHLSIFLNGEQLAVPSHIGIVETSPTSHCNYSVHTHDHTGVIHVESPSAGLFTLGQLFALWGQPLSYDNIADISGIPVVAYITDNGVVTQYTGDLSAIELLSHREITLQLGMPIAEIPVYMWTGP